MAKKFAIRKLSMAARTQMIDIEMNHDTTSIIGGNGTGKTTVLDAIMWGMTGSPINGSTGDIIGCDDTASRVTLVLENEDGEQNVYIRSINRNVDGSTASTFTQNHVPVSANTTPVGLPSKTLAVMMNPLAFFEMSKADKESVILGLTKDTVQIGESVIAISYLPTQIKNQQKAITQDEEAIAQVKYQIDEHNRYEASVAEFEKMLIDYGHDWDELLKYGFTTVLNNGGNVETFVQFCNKRQNALHRMDILEALKSNLKSYEDMLKKHTHFLEECEKAYQESLKRLVGVISDYGCDVSLEKHGPNSVKSVIDIAVKGVSTATLSRKEKAQAAIWLSEAFHQISGVIVPVLIDGIEGIGHIDPPADSAQFITTAYEEDMPLAVAIDANMVRAIDNSIIRRTPKAKARRVEYV